MAHLNGFNGKHIALRQACLGSFPDEAIISSALQSIEFLNGLVEISSAKKNIECMAEGILEEIVKYDIDKLVIWNGEQLIGRAAKIVAKKLNIKTQFLEISNLPNKIFSDPEGVNASARLYREIDVIDKLPDISVYIHDKWVKEYEIAKEKPLPQAQRKKIESALSILNVGLKNIFQSTRPVSITKKASNAFSDVCYKIKKINFDISVTSPKDKYIFLPLQVSADTQLKLNSDIKNLEAIDFAYAKAKEDGMLLVVKIHPAEKSAQELKLISKKQSELKFLISQENTISLIKNAAHVVTINSTVGLEALIYKKPITVLGRCFYKDFDQIRLRKYIHSYLVGGADYFDSKKISTACALKIVNAIDCE